MKHVVVDALYRHSRHTVDKFTPPIKPRNPIFLAKGFWCSILCRLICIYIEGGVQSGSACKLLRLAGR